MRNRSKKMTEGSNHIAQVDTDKDLEDTAVAGAVAVQKLIADRISLRNQLALSLAAQEELRRSLGMLHQAYIELARKVMSNMQQFDNTMREAMGERLESSTEAGNTEPIRQFDKNGLPAGSHPAGHAYNGSGLPKGLAQLKA
jgi:hypothetical protein